VWACINGVIITITVIMHLPIVDRGLLWSTVRRIQPLTLESFGQRSPMCRYGLCTSIYSQEDCQFWSGDMLMGFGGKKLGDLSKQGITGNAANNILLITPFS